MTEVKEPFTIILPFNMEIAEFKTEPIYSVSSTVYPADATTRDQMHLVETSGILEFWNDPAEDAYNEDDNGL